MSTSNNKSITLNKVTVYAMSVSDDDIGGNVTTTYFKDSNVAHAKAKGAGFYGSNGTVEPVTMWQDVNGSLYELSKAVRLVDEDAKVKEDLIKSIKTKLTAAELELLKIA